MSNKQWSEQLAEKAYELLGDKKFPIVVPSYNRPNNKFLKYVKENFTKERYFEVYFIVRESQSKSYEEASKNVPGISILSVKDSKIDNICKVRQFYLDYFSDKYKNIIVSDDDVFGLYVNSKQPSKSGVMYSRPLKTIDFVDALATFQLAHLISIEHNVVLSSCPVAGLSFNADCTNEETSIAIQKGIPTQFIAINLELLNKHGLKYNITEGHEDLEICIDALKKGLCVADFTFINYKVDQMLPGFNGSETMEERMSKQCRAMLDKYSDIDFITHTTNKKGIENIRINWRKFKSSRKYLDIMKELNLD